MVVVQHLVRDEVVRVLVPLGGADLTLGVKVDALDGFHHLTNGQYARSIHEYEEDAPTILDICTLLFAECLSACN